MTISDLLLFTAEMVGIVAFALSGAMTALKYDMDLLGIPFLATVTALGGGVLRDLLIGRLPPVMFRDYRYLLAVVITALLVFLAARFAWRRYHLVEEKLAALGNICDAVGLGPFTVVGIEAGIAAGYGDNSFFLVFLGVVTCVGGGILRDLFVARIPGVLKKHVYALPCILGACLYLLLTRNRVNDLAATLLVTAFIFVFRMLATKFRWNLPKARKN